MSSVSLAQWILGVLWPTLLIIEKSVIVPGGLQDAVVAATNSIFAVLVVIFRKPSTEGGTVAPAPTIAPGTTVVQAAPAKK